MSIGKSTVTASSGSIAGLPRRQLSHLVNAVSTEIKIRQDLSRYLTCRE
jgi:hypothetical protein